MKDTHILEILKSNDESTINDFLQSGTEINKMIDGKSLLTHAVLLKSTKAISLLILAGAKH